MVGSYSKNGLRKSIRGYSKLLASNVNSRYTMRGASRTIFLQKRFIMKKILLAATTCLALASAPVKADTFLETSVSMVQRRSVHGLVACDDCNVSARLIQLDGTDAFRSWMCSASVRVRVTSSSPISTTSRAGSRLYLPGMANITAAQAQQIASLAFLGSSSNSGPFLDAVLQLAVRLDMAVRSVHQLLGSATLGQHGYCTCRLPCLAASITVAVLVLHVMSGCPVPVPSAGVRVCYGRGSAGALHLGNDDPWLLWHRRHGCSPNKRKDRYSQAFRFACVPTWITNRWVAACLAATVVGYILGWMYGLGGIR